MARIEDYALLGDLQTAALVDRGGSVDWLCFPRFDSGACFAVAARRPGERPLGARARAAGDEHAPLPPRHARARDDLDDGGRLGRARDRLHAAARQGARHRAHRRGRQGLRPLPLGADDPLRLRPHRPVGAQARRTRQDTRVAIAGPDALCFRTRAETRGEDMRTVSEFSVDEGERVPFVLTWFPSHEEVPEPIDPEQALDDTETFWREWSEACPLELPGDWAALVRRSLIVLKALTYDPTGGIVAAPTTSLPEWIGSVRNWDYRYCWLRDATLTLLALLHCNHADEAATVAALAAPRDRGRPGRRPDHVRRRRRAAARASSSCRGSTATRARSRCASATPRATSSSSTSTARCSTASTRRASTASRSTRRAGRSSSACSTISPRRGASRTTASGRSAASAGTSSIPR